MFTFCLNTEVYYFDLTNHEYKTSTFKEFLELLNLDPFSTYTNLLNECAMYHKGNVAKLDNEYYQARVSYNGLAFIKAEVEHLAMQSALTNSCKNGIYRFIGCNRNYWRNNEK